MSNDELKRELLEIATLLEKFPPSIQPQVFELLTSNLGTVKTTPKTSGIKHDPSNKKPAGKKPSATPTKSKRSGARENVGIVKDLNLRGSTTVKAFKAFAEEKAPSSNIEFTTVAVYYLAKLAGVTGVTPAHINTCYKEVNRRPPENFKQNIFDTSSHRYGYIDASDMSNIMIPHRGEMFVEHDLPHKDKKSK